MTVRQRQCAIQILYYYYYYLPLLFVFCFVVLVKKKGSTRAPLVVQSVVVTLDLV